MPRPFFLPSPVPPIDGYSPETKWQASLEDAVYKIYKIKVYKINFSREVWEMGEQSMSTQPPWETSSQNI